MKRKAKKQAGRKQRVLTEAELKKIAAGNIWEDVRDTWNTEAPWQVKEGAKRMFGW